MARDARYRPFRIALWVVYLLVVAVSVGLAVRSIVKNLRAPHRPAAAGVLPTRAAMRVCVNELEALHREQNTRAWRLGDEVAEGEAIDRWQAWARDWEQRVNDLADRCRLDAEVVHEERVNVGRRFELLREAARAVTGLRLDADQNGVFFARERLKRRRIFE